MLQDHNEEREAAENKESNLRHFGFIIEFLRTRLARCKLIQDFTDDEIRRVFGLLEVRNVSVILRFIQFKIIIRK